MGIDYGMGTTNIDRVTGIRYGVISQYSIMQAWSDSSEPELWCEHCDCADDERENCDAEATSYTYAEGGYDMASCLDSDVMIIKSPFYTYAPFCSPCVPGAGNLDGACRYPQDEAKRADCLAYCPGHDWFEDGKAPYVVLGVVSARECFPDVWYGC